MIINKQGDLLQYLKNGSVDAICHCCNIEGVMGAGIALQIKNQFPEAYEAYKTCEDFFGLELGTISVAPNLKVFNLHAQTLVPGKFRQVNYEALFKCLELTRDELHASFPLGHITLGIPRLMASALAGGDWRIVEQMIAVVFEDSSIEVIIVEYIPEPPKSPEPDDDIEDPCFDPEFGFMPYTFGGEYKEEGYEHDSYGIDFGSVSINNLTAVQAKRLMINLYDHLTTNGHSFEQYKESSGGGDFLREKP